MLLHASKHLPRHISETIIAATVVAAIYVPFLLSRYRALDPPALLADALLMLAIIPPNVAALRHNQQ